MNRVTVKLSANANLKRLVKCWMPHYRKRSVSIRGSETVEPFGWCWDGGSKSDYFLANIKTGKIEAWHAPAYPSTHAEMIVLKPDWVVLVAGVFCGKPATLSITCHPEDYAALVG